MTSIASAAITTDTGPPAAVQKAMGQPNDAGDSSSFAAMLASEGGPEQVRRVDLSSEEWRDLLAPDAAAVQREVSLPTQTAAVAPQPTIMMQSAVQVAYLAFVAVGRTDAPTDRPATVPSRAGGMNDPADDGRSGVSVAQSIGIPLIGGAFDLVEALAQKSVVPDRSAVAPGSFSAPSVRQETHLIAGTSLAAAIHQRVLGHANADGDSNSPGSDGRPLAEAVPGLANIGPGADESEGVTVQIVGQVAGALASLRGASPVDTAPGSAPVSTVGPPSEPASDVVKTIRFDLKPGELGEVHVRLSMSRNEVRLHLSFSNDKAAGLAQAECQALEQALTDAGASVGQIVIDAVSLPRVEALSRPGGLQAQTELSSGSPTGGNGADRERQSHQEAARRHALGDRSSDQTDVAGNPRAGLFI